ncbi:GFA family protein [Pseudomonas sp. CAN2814]|uniref:GFA family protein n=1 Tax=Pseudomonas sp. CAN1 TaxID=3046726 RepID=UPI00264988E5|nr:GFA family protein [Pseudomonas sp. CAN1]MDN6857073.1 GFA family protein [Pseudomonas sp. CAN1]
MPYNGSCLCGDIGYAVDSLDMPIGHCHCLTCQKAHSAAFASTAGVMREHFRWTRGEDKVAAYESSPGKQRKFCPRCGTQLIAERAGQPHVIVRVASLDDDPGVRPARHIWTSHDRPWLAQDGVPAYPEWNPDR